MVCEKNYYLYFKKQIFLFLVSLAKRKKPIYYFAISSCKIHWQSWYEMRKTAKFLHQRVRDFPFQVLLFVCKFSLQNSNINKNHTHTKPKHQHWLEVIKLGFHMLCVLFHNHWRIFKIIPSHMKPHFVKLLSFRWLCKLLLRGLTCYITVSSTGKPQGEKIWK